MAGYGTLGALSGLGRGLESFGKQYMANEMQKERENRLDQRQRQKIDPSMNKFYEKDGVLMKQERNAFGEVINDTLASKDEIEDRNYNTQKRANEGLLSNLKMKNAEQDLALGDKKLGSYDEDRQWEREDRGLKRELTRSQIEENQAQGYAARRRGDTAGLAGSLSDSGADKSKYDYIDKLATDQTAKAELAKYVDADGEPLITDADKADLYEQAVNDAAKFGLDPRTALKELLFQRFGGKQGK